MGALLLGVGSEKKIRESVGGKKMFFRDDKARNCLKIPYIFINYKYSSQKKIVEDSSKARILFLN